MSIASDSYSVWNLNTIPLTFSFDLLIYSKILLDYGVPSLQLPVKYHQLPVFLKSSLEKKIKSKLVNIKKNIKN